MKKYKDKKWTRNQYVVNSSTEQGESPLVYSCERKLARNRGSVYTSQDNCIDLRGSRS
jgi:hypothetical protein